MGDRAESAPNVQLEAAPLLAVDFAFNGHHAKVVHVHQSAGMLATARKGRLEFAPKVLPVGMAQHEVRERVGIGRYIEGFIAANARERTRRDVPNGVPAGLAGRYPNRRKPPHEIGRIADVNVMHLKVLARRNVQHPDRVLFRKVRHRLQLIRTYPARRNFQTHHARSVENRFGAFGNVFARIVDFLRALPVMTLAVVVPLAVDAPAKPLFRENLFVNAARVPQLNLRVEDVDFPGQIGRHLAG